MTQNNSRFQFKALGFLAAAVLSGCATTPAENARTEITIPNAWSAESPAENPTAWLDDFASNELDTLVAEALQNNADLARTASVIDQSVAEARLSGADRLPSAELGLGANRQQINTFGPSATGGVIFENYDLGLNLSWELDLWGRLSDIADSATAQVEIREAEFEAARLSLAAQVSKAWFNLIEARLQLNASQQIQDAYRENLRTIESRFARGIAQANELHSIRALSQNAAADVSTREQNIDRATRQLETLLGRYPSAELSSSVELPALPKAIPAGVPADLIQRRPDLIAAERRLASAGFDYSAQRKNLLPRLSLTASGGTSSREFENLLDGDFKVWSIAGNLAQPVFRGGRIRSNIARSASVLQQAQASYTDAALQAFYEVESALAAEAFLKTQHASLQSAADESEALAQRSWQRYENGTGDLLELLDAQRNAASSRSNLIRIRNSILQNRIDLYLALGGPLSSKL